MPKKIDNFLEGGVLRQRVDVITLVTENAFVSVNKTNVRGSGDDAFQTCACDGHIGSLLLLFLL